MILVDTNVIAYLFVRGEETARAQAALARDPEWAAPQLWRSEFRNVLARLQRRGVVSLAQALEIMNRAVEQMAAREFAVASDDVLTLAAESGCSAYDCEFVTLARDLRVRLVTTDHQVLSAFPTTAVPLDQFIA